MLRLRGNGHGRWPARRGAVVRVVQRAVLCEVGEDGADGCGFLDAGHDPYRTAAVDAGAHVDAKHALETLRPAHRAAALVGGAFVTARSSRFRVGGRLFAAPRRRQLRTQTGVWCEYAVETGQVGAWWRDQRRQLGDEIHRIPFDMGGSIPPRVLNCASD